MGTRLSNSVLLVLLKDPFYCGLIHWKGQEKIGKHEAMISVDEHHQILNIISAHNQHASRRRIHNFLLRGFLFCDICNGRCVGDKHRQYTHYHCSQKIQKHGNKGQNVATLEIEEQVEELFKTIKFSKTFINLIIHKVKRFYEKQRKEKNHKIRILLNKKMRAEKDRVIAEKKLIAGVFDDEDFGRVKARSKQEEATFDSQIDELKEENEIDFETIRQILILAKDIYGAYKKAPYELKRLYLSLFWDGFWIKDQIIVKKEPSNLIKTLQSEHKILLTPYWCTTTKTINTIVVSTMIVVITGSSICIITVTSVTSHTIRTICITITAIAWARVSSPSTHSAITIQSTCTIIIAGATRSATT
jgi:hypothetical protein